MQLNPKRIRQYLKSFDFEQLFIDELGWDIFRTPLKVTVDQQDYPLRAVAEKRGLVAYICPPGPDGSPPDHHTRGKIEHQVNRSVREHLIIFVDELQTIQIWQWVRREPGKLLARREHHYHVNQSGEALLQKLQAITFSLEVEESLTLIDVLGGARAAFDVEKVTKRFYDLFKKERDAFHQFLSGIPETEMQRWYVSVMLNRLMFIYFIQRKGFLSGNENYLRDKLAESQNQGQDRFYREFLWPLFFEGLAKKERPAQFKKLLGTVPYLNGSLFVPHEIEEQYGPKIQIKDAAFERLFEFFDQWQWHLDERPLRNDNEVNPDVLGYIFEKYINQKQMGAYYTKEDITEYIGKSTIIPFLFDEARKECKIAFEGEQSIWNLLQADPDRYIYDAVKKGVKLPLPEEIAIGLKDVSQRSAWNTLAPREFALPTEIWREVVHRRQRYEEVRAKLVAGEIRRINDLITYNLNLRQFAQDVIESCEGPELLRAFYKAIEQVTILDPTVGSGAFLFAALNILEPMYEACIERMASFVADYDLITDKPNPAKFKDFREILARIKQHPNRRYFILKSIIVNNLFGVDIMAEAVEICKLRLFLKLVAQVERTEQIEPLPDIDFNIQAGNTLVGYATYEEVKRALTEANVGQGTVSPLVSGEGVGRVQQNKMLFTEDLEVVERFEQKAVDVDRLFQHFRQQQTELGGQVTAADKQELRRRLKGLEDELNAHLACEYGVDPKKAKAYQNWLESHQPFHWFIEFYGILKQGGFDVIIGNPPYVEYRLVKNSYRLQPNLYRSEEVANLYAFCMERSCILLHQNSWFGMIVPAGVLGLDKASSLREVLFKKFSKNYCSTYSIRPSKLFDGVDQRLCIYLSKGGKHSTPIIWTTRYQCWNTEERASLFHQLDYKQSFLHERLSRIPQVGNPHGMSIFRKLEAHRNKIISVYYGSSHSGHLMHYHRSPRYWIRAMDFEQYFKSPTRTKSVHHFRDLYFWDSDVGKVIGALLNSSLFFFWFVSIGNGRNITGTDVELFPVGDLSDRIVKIVPSIFDRLMTDYKRNSFIRQRTGSEFQEFRPSKSKPIIDEIDRALAQHYNFTDEELDFIINYDIKYRLRLGDASPEDEDDEAAEDE